MNDDEAQTVIKVTKSGLRTFHRETQVRNGQLVRWRENTAYGAAYWGRVP